MKIILFGAQGSGKGTMGAMLSKRYKIPLLGTGAMFRKAIKKGTKVGKIAEGYINKGKLVPDKITTDIVKERIKQKDCKKGYILDGFPRTLKQASLFKDEMSKIDFLIELVAPEKILIYRLSGRRMHKKTGKIYNIHPDLSPKPPKSVKLEDLYQRKDDKPDFIKKRLKIYHKETEPILKKYKDRVIKVAATGNPNLIMKRLVKIIK